MHLQPVFEGCKVYGGEVAEGLFERGLCLPSGSILTEMDRRRVIEVVRGCFAQLDEDDRTLADQLEAIMDRKWRVAAAALGLSESTLRSRWKRVLDRLRRCMERKTDVGVAPGRFGGDR